MRSILHGMRNYTLKSGKIRHISCISIKFSRLPMTSPITCLTNKGLIWVPRASEAVKWTYRFASGSNFVPRDVDSTPAVPTSGTRANLSEPEITWENRDWYTKFTYPTIYLSHIPQCTIQNRNVHISVLNGILWDMGQVYCGICKTVIIDSIVKARYQAYPFQITYSSRFGRYNYKTQNRCQQIWQRWSNCE